jgi:hypothetical protein
MEVRVEGWRRWDGRRPNFNNIHLLLNLPSSEHQRLAYTVPLFVSHKTRKQATTIRHWGLAIHHKGENRVIGSRLAQGSRSNNAPMETKTRLLDYFPSRMLAYDETLIFIAPITILTHPHVKARSHCSNQEGKFSKLLARVDRQSKVPGAEYGSNFITSRCQSHHKHF